MLSSVAKILVGAALSAADCAVYITPTAAEYEGMQRLGQPSVKFRVNKNVVV